MSKEKSIREKSVKKEAVKSLKEKRADKEAKRQEKNRGSSKLWLPGISVLMILLLTIC